MRAVYLLLLLLLLLYIMKIKDAKGVRFDQWNELGSSLSVIILKIIFFSRLSFITQIIFFPLHWILIFVVNSCVVFFSNSIFLMKYCPHWFRIQLTKIYLEKFKIILLLFFWILHHYISLYIYIFTYLNIYKILAIKILSLFIIIIMIVVVIVIVFVFIFITSYIIDECLPMIIYFIIPLRDLGEVPHY